MKVGVRKPSIKRSIKARTTGRAKRSIKKSINPLYGKKGMGWVRNPKKAMYNKIYKKTTVGVGDIARIATKPSGARKKKRGLFDLIVLPFVIVFSAIGKIFKK